MPSVITLFRAEVKKLHNDFYTDGDIDKPTEKKERYDKLMMAFAHYYEHKVEFDDNLSKLSATSLL